MGDDDTFYRVLAVNLNTAESRVLASGKTKADADAIMSMAVMRRGVDEEYFVVEPESPAGSAVPSEEVAS